MMLKSWKFHVLAVVLFLTTLDAYTSTAGLLGGLLGVYLVTAVLYRVGQGAHAFWDGVTAD